MYRPSRTLLAALRGRFWRLAALCLWGMALAITLAGFAAQPAQAFPFGEDFRASLCHSGGSGSDAGSDDGADGAGSAPGHCPWCKLSAATSLAAPDRIQIALLIPAVSGTAPGATQAESPVSTPPAAPPQPRGPPASV